MCSSMSLCSPDLRCADLFQIRLKDFAHKRTEFFALKPFNPQIFPGSQDKTIGKIRDQDQATKLINKFVARDLIIGQLQMEVTFKKKVKRGNARQRRNSDDDERERGADPENVDIEDRLAGSGGADKSAEDEDEHEMSVHEKISMIKELRKLRERPHGVSTVTLALGKKAQLEEEVVGPVDPFKTKAGGMIDMDSLKSGKFQQDKVDDAYETGIGIGTQFSAETNTRDEDAEMLKYIEQQLSEKKRLATLEKEGPDQEPETKKFMSAEEMALMSLPEYLRKSGSTKSEEMLSNQMLSGIPEVDLGIEVKIRNIERTEEAKQKIIRDSMNKKEGPSQFVPTNMAVNFVQHNRFNIEEPNSRNQNKRKAPVVEEKPKKKVVVVGAEPEEQEVLAVKEKGDKATDDFHFEKFRKQFRRF